MTPIREAIGPALGRSVSTMSREIARKTATTVGYLPCAAHRIEASRRRRVVRLDRGNTSRLASSPLGTA